MPNPGENVFLQKMQDIATFCRILRLFAGFCDFLRIVSDIIFFPENFGFSVYKHIAASDVDAKKRT